MKIVFIIFVIIFLLFFIYLCLNIPFSSIIKCNNLKDKRIFCESCDYLDRIDDEFYCSHKSNIEEVEVNFLEVKSEYISKAENLNAKNDCKNYKRRINLEGF